MNYKYYKGYFAYEELYFKANKRMSVGHIYGLDMKYEIKDSLGKYFVNTIENYILTCEKYGIKPIKGCCPQELLEMKNSMQIRLRKLPTIGRKTLWTWAIECSLTERIVPDNIGNWNYTEASKQAYKCWRAIK